MKRKVKVLSALVAGMLGVAGVTSSAHAVLSKDQYKCQTTIGKEGAKFVKGVLKARQKCIEKNLKTPGDCGGADLTKLRTKLANGITKACDRSEFGPNATAISLSLMGFPGICSDPLPSNGFTLDDLITCIRDGHEDLVDQMIDVQYDPAVQAGPLTDTALKCQKEIGKNAGKFVDAILKNVQKCRNDLLNCKIQLINNQQVAVCKKSGFQAKDCATVDADTAEKIAKAKGKAEAAIAGKCSDADVMTIQACEPDQMMGTATATCETAANQLLTDNPAVVPFDFLDYEYAQPASCGDDHKNRPAEECDGADDAACPGECGDSLGFFPCLCQNIPRTRVVEHANADLDNGWTGLSHDSGIVEGGGYVTDLYDCDGPGGPDTLCNVGPSCSLPPHSSCSPLAPIGSSPPLNQDTGDEICALLGQGTCRITAGGSTGPHCEIDFQKRCDTDGDCQVVPGDHCVVVPHGAPLPLASGGVQVCVVNEFSEDVAGTTDLATGEGSVRLRQFSTTYLGNDAQQPCPICGGFCSGEASDSSPINRTRCDSNADCTNPGSICVMDFVCSYGPNKDRPCRPNAPAGGPTDFFGNPSVDCPVGAQTALGKLDILFNPASTGTVSATANTFCNRTGYNNKTCTAGANQHAVCTVDSECPGGTCNNQCFCGGGSQAPNACNAACVGGPDDAAPCVDNSECTAPGFCHPGDCRVNPADPDDGVVPTEGQCTVGPGNSHCSTHTFVSCTSNAQCQAPLCQFCDGGETCVTELRQCFTNPTYSRVGAPGVPDRTSAAVFCIAATGSDAVNNVAGLPGPGAIRNPTTTMETGF
jgi:hypothetical protein